MTDKLQRLMNAAAHLVTGTHKFDHSLSRLLHDDLHWLDVSERIQYKISVTVHCCLQSKAPKYLTDCCTPVSEIASRCHLCSASRHNRSVPHYHIICCRPDGLELSTRQSPRPWDQQQLQATTQDGLFQPLLSTLSAVEMLHDSVLYTCMTIGNDTDIGILINVRKQHIFSDLS